MFDVEATIAVISGVAGGAAAGVTRVRLARDVAADFAATRGWLTSFRAERSAVRDARRLLGFHQRDG